MPTKKSVKIFQDEFTLSLMYFESPQANDDELKESVFSQNPELREGSVELYACTDCKKFVVRGIKNKPRRVGAYSWHLHTHIEDVWVDE